MRRGAQTSRPSPAGSASVRKAGRGQSLVEFAIFIPVLVTVLLLAVDVGRIYMGWVNLSNVAKIGANFAAQNPRAWDGGGDTTIQARYRTLMVKDAAGIDCTLPSTLPPPNFPDSDQYALGSRAQVDLTCSFALITPFLSSVIGDGAGHITVGTSAVFLIRTGSVDGVVIDGNSVPGSATPAPTSIADDGPDADSNPDRHAHAHGNVDRQRSPPARPRHQLRTRRRPRRRRPLPIRSS